jgi:hypothetical protein
MHSFLFPLQINDLSSMILGKDIISSHRPPAVYTAEKFGVEYLYAQLEANMEVTDSNIDQGVETVELDEGFGDEITEDFAAALPSELLDDEDEEEVSTLLHGVFTYK